MTDLEQERAAHAATREELRRAQRALSSLAVAGDDICEMAPAFIASRDVRSLANYGGNVARIARAALSSAPTPAPLSTEAAVRAGIEAANTAVGGVCGNNAALVAAHAAIRALDPAAIAARLEGR